MNTIAVKEKPFPFTTDMVIATLEGIKTNSRRVAKLNYAGRVQLNGKQWHVDDPDAVLACPYGQPGDRLWVRETWRIESFTGDEPILFGYRAGGQAEENEFSDCLQYEDWAYRMAMQCEEDCEKAGLKPEDDGYYRWDNGKSPCRWRPPRYMPRWASRISLQIINVRLEKLQHITEKDAMAEGVTPNYDIMPGAGLPHIVGFSYLWDSINEKRGYGWLVNPWVWVIEFKLLGALLNNRLTQTSLRSAG